MTPDLFEWIERLGGWAVVGLIVHWLLARQDRLITALEKSVQAYGDFQKTNDEAHREIVTTLKQIRDKP